LELFGAFPLTLLELLIRSYLVIDALFTLKPCQNALRFVTCDGNQSDCLELEDDKSSHTSLFKYALLLTVF